ncbi:MAG: ATP-binding protein [Bacteroidota bacterium]
MSILFVFCGLPGTGKSALAREICDANPEFHFFSLEKARRALKHETYLPERNAEVYQKNYFEMQFSMSERKPIIFDSNSSVIKRRTDVIKLAKRYQYQVILLEFTCPEEVAKQRIKHRPVANDGLFEEPNTPFVYDTLKHRWEHIGKPELRHKHVHYFVYDSHQHDLECVVGTEDSVNYVYNLLESLAYETET